MRFPVTILSDDFAELNSYIAEAEPSVIFFLADENTHEHCLPILLANLETDIPFEILEVEPGEEMKTLETAGHLWQILTEMQADRNVLLINIGGGVITDLGGFVASAYKRGIRFVHVPTTLLAICDASIGGKAGVDLNYVKNVIGTFAIPEHIFVYSNFLRTLDDMNMLSGFAEMLKHGLIADRQHWENLISIKMPDADSVKPFLFESMQIKQKIVAADFKEKNIRKTLNFGHTIGHAAESLLMESGKTVPHGFAVAMGMICETYLSIFQEMLSKTEGEEIIGELFGFFPQLDLTEIDNEALLTVMENDKKNSGGQCKFVLLNTIGKCSYDVEVPKSAIFDSLNFYRNLTAGN